MSQNSTILSYFQNICGKYRLDVIKSIAFVVKIVQFVVKNTQALRFVVCDCLLKLRITDDVVLQKRVPKLNSQSKFNILA